MAIINLYNKKLNVTYVYDSVSYWDKDLKQPRSKRKLIGKRDPVTNEMFSPGSNTFVRSFLLTYIGRRLKLPFITLKHSSIFSRE